MSQYNNLIIDGNNFLFRAFFTKRPDKMINGFNVIPIHQFLYMLKSVVDRFKPNEVFLTWDKKLQPTQPNFRKELCAYKEQREENYTIQQLFKTIPLIQEFVDALGIKTVYPSNLEGDDVISFLSKNSIGSTIIISSDQDLLQLVSENVHVFLPSKNLIVNLDNFQETTGVAKNQFILYKCVLGDKSDNIFGLDGYGPVKAKVLSEKLSNNDFSDVSDDQKLIIENNIKIMDLNYAETTYPEEIDFYKKQLEAQPSFDSNKLRTLFSTYEFHTFSRKFGEWNDLFNKSSNFDLLSMISM